MKIEKSRIVVFALASVLFAATSSLSAKPSFKVDSNSETGIETSGQQVTFTVRPITDESSVEPATVEVLRDFIKPPLVDAEIATGTTYLDVPFTSDESGWYVCSTFIPSQKHSAGASGIVYDSEKFQPTYPMPADFITFWDSHKERLASNPAEPILSELSPEQMASATDKQYLEKNITEMSAKGYKFFNIEIPCLDYRPVRGYYVLPPNAEPGEHPAMVIFHAAGVSGRWCRSNLNNALKYAEQYNAIVLDINAHGMLNDQPQSYYDELAKELDDYQHSGMHSRETSYFLGMYLRLMRAIDYLCNQPEWDGKNLICFGPSQGGAQTLAAAGLDQRVSIACALVPATCDIGGTPGGWPARDWGESTYQPEVVEALRYYDATNFCQLSQAATVITIGLVDTVCPPPGVFAAYNQLKSPKLIISMPSTGHIGGSNLKPGIREPVEAFILKHMKN